MNLEKIVFHWEEIFNSGNSAHTTEFLALGKALKIWIYNQVLFLNTSNSVFQKQNLLKTNLECDGYAFFSPK